MSFVLSSSYFRGEWRFERVITGGYEAQGHALFALQTEHSDELGYSETGQLFLPDGRQLEAQQTYIFAPMGNRLCIYFDETPPRLFHDLVLSPVHERLEGQGRHHCGDDIYESLYAFLSATQFEVTHIVKGPRKDYVSKTMYWRVSTALEAKS